MSSSGDMDTSEVEDLQSYLSAHKSSNHGNEEIDWTKLMESGDLDKDLDLKTDKPLYTTTITYRDSEESAAADLFLKTPAKSQDRSQTNNKKKRRLSARRSSFGADPNLHVASELNLASELTDITLTSATDDSVSVSGAAVHRPRPGAHTGREKRLKERNSLNPTKRVRNVSDLSLSSQTHSEHGESGGGAALQVVPPRASLRKSLSDEDESSLQLSVTTSDVSEGEGVNFGRTVFSIDQLEDPGGTGGQVQTTPTQPGGQDQATPTESEFSENTSSSEHLNGGYAVNIHTVDELLVDGWESEDKKMASENRPGVGNDDPKTTESSPLRVITGTQDTVTIHSNRDSIHMYKEAIETPTNLRVGTFRLAPSPLPSDEGRSAADDRDSSYSVDEDFESATVTPSSVGEGPGSRSSVGGTESGVGGEGVRPCTGEDDETEYQYSSFSEEEVTADHTIVSRSQPPIDHCPAQTKQPPTTRKHSNTRQSSQQDASVQTPPYLCPGPAPNHTPSLLNSGQPHPTPILPFVLSAEKLEALSTYAPHSIALDDMIKGQLALIRHSMETVQHQVTAIHNTLNSDHHYTTLEETRDYIERNKPRTLTMKEAKKRYQGTRNT